MKKNIFFRMTMLVLLVCLLAGLAVCASAEEAEPTAKGMAGDYVYWYFYEDTGLLKLEGEGPTREFNRVGTSYEDIPWGKYRDSITQIEIGDGITYLGRYVFKGCSKVTKVVIPDSVTRIGRDAFVNCKGLAEVTLPKDLEQIDARAFQGCQSLLAIEFPASLTTIDEAAFEGCKSLTSVVVPETITTMYGSVFRDCSSLMKVELNAKISGLPGYTFKGCTSLKEIVIPEGYTTIHGNAFDGCTALQDVTLPSTMERIVAMAFYKCTALEYLILPEGFQSMENYAMSGSGIREITFPDSTTTIGLAALQDTANLEKVVILSPDCNINNQHNALGNPEKVEIHGYSGSTAHEAAVAKSYFFVSLGEWKCTHPNTEIRDAKEATCSAEGYTGNTFCLRCETTIAYGISIPRTDHTEEIRNAKEPTCTVEGYTGDSWCTVCNTQFAYGIPIHLIPHTFGDWEETKAPTDSEEGTETRKCSACGLEEHRSIDRLNPFVDVKEGTFYYLPVQWAVKEEITTGVTPTEFKPLDGCSRAHIVTFLWRFAGEPEPETTVCPFTDLKEGSWYYKAVLWAAENGITTGTTATTFSPSDTCTRGQIVTFLWRFGGEESPKSTEHPFTDISAGKFYYTAVLWAVENGITSGMTPTTFCPGDPCTRGHAVTFLYRHD